MFEILRDLLRCWWTVFSNFPKKTTFHGFKFIADSQRHWTERVFWLFFVSLSWYGSFRLIAAQYDAYKNNPISFVVDTDYKDWTTDFPSVAVCESDNVKRVEETSDILWTPEHDFNLEEVLKEVAYFKGIAYYTSQFCGLNNPLPGCISNNLTYYANLVRSSCEDILANCSWNGQQFDCCKYFRPLQTEMGTCFTINSIQGEEENPPKYPMTSNRTTGPGSLRFSILVQSNVYILNAEDVPSLTTMGSDLLTLGPETFHRREITIRSIENDAEARSIPPSRRKCRYVDENSSAAYRFYSYSACTVQCRKEAQIAACGCTNFFMPHVSEAMKCNVSGLICLNDHISEFSAGGMMLLWVLASLALVTFAKGKQQEVSEDNCLRDYTVNESSTKCYKLHYKPELWLSARFICEHEGAYLAMPQNAEEAAYLGAQLKNYNHDDKKQWLSAIKYRSTPDYRKFAFIDYRIWDDDVWRDWAHRPINKGIPWALGEPNNAESDERCLTIDGTGHLNDYHCSHPVVFFCEHELNDVLLVNK